MQDLVKRRCFNHPDREAVARCPECGRFFCRECITEHEDRVLCAACLGKLSAAPKSKRKRLALITRFVQSAIGIWLIWIFFYYMARILLSIPSSFHEGTLWQEAWW